jgi:hypothetical protein
MLSFDDEYADKKFAEVLLQRSLLKFFFKEVCCGK